MPSQGCGGSNLLEWEPTLRLSFALKRISSQTTEEVDGRGLGEGRQGGEGRAKSLLKDCWLHSACLAQWPALGHLCLKVCLLQTREGDRDYIYLDFQVNALQSSRPGGDVTEAT